LPDKKSIVNFHGRDINSQSEMMNLESQFKNESRTSVKTWPKERR